MKVLIVEDNANDRKLLHYIMEHNGCEVVEARDGTEGLEQVTLHRPDLIISDALMPRMDGFQLLRKLKTEPELATIPFLFHSAVYTGEAEERLALALGAAAFVVKPIEPEQLWNVVSALVSGEKPHPARHIAIDDQGETLLLEYGRIVATKLEEKVHELEEALERRGRAEEALRRQEEELAAIFENAPFLLLLLDNDRIVRRVNELVCSFSGQTAGEMLGKRSGDALRCLSALNNSQGCGFGSDCATCTTRRTILDTFETGRSHYQIETSLPVNRGGKEHKVPLLLSTTRVTVAEKNMVLLSLQDISEYKNLELQLHHAQRLESIGTLAGGIAHDFNNILTVIIGYGDITLMNKDAPDPLRQNVEHMLDAARRAACLAKDLLLFSRKQVCDKKNVDLNEVVRSMEKFFVRVIGENITCSILPADGVLTVFADAHQLEQVLMNLVTNARDAMPGGGALEISTGRMVLDEPFIAAHGFGRCGECALLTIADNGMGMDDVTCQQIFDPFFTTKEVGKGTGLGLSVVYGIVKQHDGYITVHSEPGHGTTFRIYLPLADISADEGTMAVQPEQVRPGTETVLLAEDDESVRGLVVTLLRKFGYEVIVAVDGEDAVEKYRENRGRIKLLLFDFIMPGKTGKGAYDEIRALDPQIKVIFTSGYSDIIHRQELIDDNIPLISKPYVPANLLELVRSVLDRAES